MSYCDSQGRPDPRGGYELIDGKICLRHGGAIVADVMLMDAAIASATSLTDAQQLEVTQAVDRARLKHDVRYAYRRESERPGFNVDAATRDATQRMLADSARAQTHDAGEAARARSEYRGALAAHRHLTSNAWRA